MEAVNQEVARIEEDMLTEVSFQRQVPSSVINTKAQIRPAWNGSFQDSADWRVFQYIKLRGCS
jgi:hypothetical protein